MTALLTTTVATVATQHSPLSPAELRVLTACQDLQSQGIYPSKDILASTLQIATNSAIVLRNRLVARGVLAITVPRPLRKSQLLTKARTGPNGETIPPTEDDLSLFEAQILRACRDMQYEGIYPSAEKLAKRFRERSLYSIGEVRDHLVKLGMLALTTRKQRSGPAKGWRNNPACTTPTKRRMGVRFVKPALAIIELAEMESSGGERPYRSPFRRDIRQVKAIMRWARRVVKEPGLVRGYVAQQEEAASCGS